MWISMRTLAVAFALTTTHLGLVSAQGSTHRAAETENVTIFEAKLDKSLVIVAIPPKPNGSVALIAHGARPSESPLRATLDVNSGFNRQLLENGCVLAATSYRRNGWITHEAIEDLRDLRRFVEKHHPNPRRVVLIGSSLGGYIGTLVAENPDGLVDGVLALGAGGFPVSENEIARTFTTRPKIPLLFLSNGEEADGPRMYARRSPPGSVAVWSVKRKGHVNLSVPVQASAWAALLTWMDGRPPALAQDASIEAVPPKSRAAFAGDSARAKVGVISAAHGNFVSEFTGEDLRQLGLNPGDKMMVEANGKSFEALWGTKYGDVPEGKGVVFVTGDGLLCIARNFANAAAFLGVKEGDEVTIRRKPDEGAAGR